MASKRLTLWPSEPKSATLLHWSTLDNILRRRRNKSLPATNFAQLDGKATCCAVSQWNCKQLILGYHTGIVKVYPLEVNNKAEKKMDAATYLKSPISLYGHLAAVRHLFVCMEYSIFVSVDEDSVIIIWDLNRLSYVRSLTVGTPTDPEIVDSITVSATLGDIAIASHGVDASPTSTLRVFTINARPVGTRQTAQNELISCLTYSTLMEGRGVNVLGAGLACGIIRLWSSWDLQHVRDIRTPAATDCIISLAFSYDCQRLIAVTQANRLLVWERGHTFGRQPLTLSNAASAASGSSGGSGRRQQPFSYWSEL